MTRYEESYLTTIQFQLGQAKHNALTVKAKMENLLADLPLAAQYSREGQNLENRIAAMDDMIHQLGKLEDDINGLFYDDQSLNLAM